MIIKLPDAFVENDYLNNTAHTVFTMMIDEIDPNKFLNYNKKYYIHGLIKYPKWSVDADLFKYMLPKYLEMLQNNQCYFLFDASTEGFSPLYREPYFEILYRNCEKYKVDENNIIFVSANLKDEENIKIYAKNKNKEQIKVFSFPSFEHVVGNYQTKTSKDLLEEEKSMTFEKYNFKYFSSLSRVNRYFRTAGTFILCQDPISAEALISHDKFENIHNIDSWKNTTHLIEYNNDEIEDWLKKLPLTVDRNDFNTTWALDTPFADIHRQTLFQIVNETLVDDHDSTSLFYSEKTFRPILHFQPFVIWGQHGCNHSLQDLGYKLYTDWFDLSFDLIKDPITRYKALLESIKKSCKEIKNLSRDEQINWKFKNKDILLHNYETMTERAYSKNKLKTFLDQL